MSEAIFVGEAFSSMAGRDIMCFRWFEQSNSSPPLRRRGLKLFFELSAIEKGGLREFDGYGDGRWG
jgi:hypothetical protein